MNYGWRFVHGTEIKTIPKEKKCKKLKWLSEEGLQIAMNRRDMKGKEEKERHIHLNAECGPLEKAMANHFSVLVREPHEQYEKAKGHETERWTLHVGRCPICYWRSVQN